MSATPPIRYSPTNSAPSPISSEPKIFYHIFCKRAKYVGEILEFKSYEKIAQKIDNIAQRYRIIEPFGIVVLRQRIKSFDAKSKSLKIFEKKYIADLRYIMQITEIYKLRDLLKNPKILSISILVADTY